MGLGRGMFWVGMGWIWGNVLIRGMGCVVEHWKNCVDTCLGRVEGQWGVRVDRGNSM